jgi:alpha-N-arabinofuranosidase
MSTVAPAPVVRAVLSLESLEATRRVSDHLFGLFIEDINYACDGGLNANLVNNHSFEGVYAERGTVPFAPPELAAELGEEGVAQLIVLTPGRRVFDRARHWTVEGGSLVVSDDDPVAVGGHFARITAVGKAVVENGGYPGGGRTMGLTGPLHLEARVRADRFEGELRAHLVDEAGAVVAGAVVALEGDGWQRVSAALIPPGEMRGALQLEFVGSGVVDIDEVALIADDHWGAGDPLWSQGRLRRDLVESLRALAPRFIRFPGGCLVEGCGDGSHYQWKNTLGPIEGRRPDYNMWGQFVADGDYSQSNQIGFYEYFLLCEDLGAAPLPVAWAGVSCQVRTDDVLPLESDEFAAVVQDAVDLVEWATGDPATNEWAALRAGAGHPEPFALDLFGIGNENYGPEYRARFERIREAVEARRPGMAIVLSTFGPDAPDTADAWEHARALGERLVVDEHFYYPDTWMRAAADRYDDYPRDTARVFIGEWSAYPPNVVGEGRERISTVALGDSAEPVQEPNTWASALAEAAFLTGVERNSDVVAFTSYAPLLNLAEHGQWAHNLIDFNPTAVAPTVNYLVQQLFATNLGEWIVPVAGEFPKAVHASATADGAIVHLKVVNAGDAAVEVDVRLDDAPDGAATGTLLRAPVTTANRLAFEGRPEVQLVPEEFEARVVGGALTLRVEPASVLVLRVPRL